jgi:tetratricopeptide (TPR) repeat protein
VTLGEKIRQARKRLGITQGELAAGELSVSFISMLEHDKVRPSMETLTILAHRLGVEVSALLDVDPPVARQLTVKLEAGLALLRQHRFTEAMEVYQAAEHLAGAQPAPEMAFRVHIGLGQALTGLNQFDLAAQHLERGRALAATLGRPELIARVASATGFLSLRKRDYPAARDFFTRALTAARSAIPIEGDLEGVILMNLGRTFSELGLPAQALDCYQGALARLEPLGDIATLGLLHFNLGVAYERQHSYESARHHFERAAGLYEAHENIRLLGSVKRSIGMLLLSQGKVQEGASVLKETLAINTQMSDDLGRAQTLTELARASVLHGDLGVARAQAEEAIRLAIKLEDPSEAARAESVMASICERQGRLDEAANRYLYALQQFEKMHNAGEVARVSREYAFLLMRRGEERQAAHLFAKAFSAQDAVVAAGTGADAGR